MSQNKSTSRAKLKAAIQEERLQMWKEYYKNLLGNSPKVTDNQLDIKVGQFTQEELNVVPRKIKSRKAAGLEVPLKYGRQGHSILQRRI